MFLEKIEIKNFDPNILHRIKLIILTLFLTVVSVFSFGMSNIYAVEYPSQLLLKQDFSYTYSGRYYSSTKGYKYFKKTYYFPAGSYIYISETNSNVSKDEYYLSFVGNGTITTLNSYDNVSFPDSIKEIEHSSGYSFLWTSSKIESLNISQDIYFFNTNTYTLGDVAFHKPLMKEVEKIIPVVTMDSQTIVKTVGVFLVGLVILLLLLRKVFKTYSRL